VIELSPTPTSTPSFSQHWRNAYKRFCERLPFVKRNRHLKIVSQLAAKTNQIADRLLSLPSHAAAANCVHLKALEPISANELCLFVSFTATPALKPHVIDHIKALAEQKIAVVLIINTDLSAAQLQLPPELVSLLHGVLVRANIGFDFAGWAHAYCLQDLPETLERLYLINDSVIGPLNLDHYAALISDFRRSPADLIGLTENAEPRAHLQSFFLAVNRRLLHAADFRRLMHGIVNLPTKSDVIECYETQLTRYVRERGYTCHAAFSNSAPHAKLIDDTIYNWARLIEQGCPFIKASVLKQVAHTAEAKRLVPARYRDSI
jgi:lipopolysaccharide biosynthesis protein